MMLIYGKMILKVGENTMLYVTRGALEKCNSDKNAIKIICPNIWIHYIIDGKGYYNGNELGKGQAFIVYKNDLCEYYPDRNDPWTYVWMRLAGNDEETLLKRCGLPSKSGVFEFDYENKLARVAPIVFSTLDLQNENRLYEESVATMILSLHIKNDRNSSPSWDERWVLKAKEYISENYHTHLTVEQIAGELHIDRQYLRNLFVKYTGMSTKKYLDHYRMKKAAELLSIKETSVGVIASSVGYPDQLSFSKAFKKYYEVSPKEYRIKHPRGGA